MSAEPLPEGQSRVVTTTVMRSTTARRTPLIGLLASHAISLSGNTLTGVAWTLVGITVCFLTVSLGALCLRSLREMDRDEGKK